MLRRISPGGAETQVLLKHMPLCANVYQLEFVAAFRLFWKPKCRQRGIRLVCLRSIFVRYPIMNEGSIRFGICVDNAVSSTVCLQPWIFIQVIVWPWLCGGHGRFPTLSRCAIFTNRASARGCRFPRTSSPPRRILKVARERGRILSALRWRCPRMCVTLLIGEEPAQVNGRLGRCWWGKAPVPARRMSCAAINAP